MVGPGGRLFKWMAALSSRLPPDSDILSDLPSWLSPLGWLPAPGNRRPTTRGNLGNLRLCRLGFCCNEKRRCSPTCRLFCISRGREHCGSGSLCLSQAAKDTGGGEGAAQGHGSGPTLKMGKTEAQRPAVVSSLGLGAAGTHRRLSAAAGLLPAARSLRGIAKFDELEH